MTAHPWQFSARFRRRAFGWRSDAPIQRIKEALAEIKAVSRKDPVLAAEGAILLIEKLSPALEQVDGSSGRLGSTVDAAIDHLVQIIASADVDLRTRQRWLDRLWRAFEADEVPWIESLGDHWGELCASPELAMAWVERLLPGVELAWARRSNHGTFFKGTTACLASLFAAGRHDQLLALLERAPHKFWHDQKWGVRALVAQGRKAEAIRHAEQSRGLNEPAREIARACEDILLSSGLADEAYRRYAIAANQGTTYLATFRALARKYPGQAREQILRDLIASTPGSEGKWFAAAKDAGLLAIAIELANTCPTDPRTLARAARDHAESQPAFAVEAGLAALRWISLGHGYELTGADVLDAWTALMKAASHAGADTQQIKSRVSELVAAAPAASKKFMTAVLGHHLGA